jgi:hypothetical protein
VSLTTWGASNRFRPNTAQAPRRRTPISKCRRSRRSVTIGTAGKRASWSTSAVARNARSSSKKLDQEYRSLQQQEAGPRAESAARKALTDAVERERRLQERKAAQDARAAEHAKWLRSCERPERFVEHERARHWLAYGQRWSDEEAAARKRRAIAESGSQPLK